MESIDDDEEEEVVALLDDGVGPPLSSSLPSAVAGEEAFLLAVLL